MNKAYSCKVKLLQHTRLKYVRLRRPVVSLVWVPRLLPPPRGVPRGLELAWLVRGGVLRGEVTGTRTSTKVRAPAAMLLSRCSSTFISLSASCRLSLITPSSLRKHGTHKYESSPSSRVSNWKPWYFLSKRSLNTGITCLVARLPSLRRFEISVINCKHPRHLGGTAARPVVSAMVRLCYTHTVCAHFLQDIHEHSLLAEF